MNTLICQARNQLTNAQLLGAKPRRIGRAAFDQRQRLQHLARGPRKDHRIRVTQGGDHAAATAEATLPGQHQATVSDSEVPLVLTRGEGLDVAERWLAESGVARDRLRLALPPSRAQLGPGDVIALGDGPMAQAYAQLADRLVQGGMA